MTLVLITLAVAASITLVLTPFVARWAIEKGICDYPSARRVHYSCIPRAGGMALFVAFFCPYFIVQIVNNSGGVTALLSKEQVFFFLGAVWIFSIGLWDDIKGLPPLIKLLGQILVGLFIWFGGINVELLSVSIHQGVSLPAWLSLFVTIFWVVLLINAINLIDGLDGLAAGICLFVSITLLALCFSTGKPMIIIGFSALAGSCLGFLRYNFNPASIFMGDCGSYFLGYLLAVLTIQGAMKSQATVALLIPIIALGVPLLDTLLAPVRRFITGKQMFKADQNHLHHILLKIGYSQRNVVLIIYGVTICLGFIALAFVFVKDQFAAFVLVIPGILVFLAVKKLGYLEYVAADKIWGWLRDITDEAGLSNERRSFLNIQMRIMQSSNVEELWETVCIAIEKLDFDLAELHLSENRGFGARIEGSAISMKWSRNNTKEFNFNDQHQFKLEMPLMDGSISVYGILWLVKDLKRNQMNYYTLRRVEHLRRTMIGVLKKITV